MNIKYNMAAKEDVIHIPCDGRKRIEKSFHHVENTYM